nr:hypothetical protein [Helicobacter pylori]
MEFYQKQTLIIVSFCLSLLIGVGLFNYLIDPFEYFRKAKYPIDWHERVGGTLLSFEGVIKHYPYNNILIGTSISLNFSLKDIHDLLGLKDPIKLTVSGMNIGEILSLLPFAFKHQPVNTVAMDLAFFEFILNKECCSTFLKITSKLKKKLFANSILGSNYMIFAIAF